jgi:DNA (cytosine-5)-methyltransferase 1
LYSVGSLFSGSGGLDLGFELAGFETKWFAETDKWCNKILEKHWPEVPNLGDVNGLERFEKVDVLIGGPPCQPVSQAGKKLAEEDPRWLWPAFYKVIRNIRPQTVVVENVPGFRKRGFDQVLGDLAESGYDAEWFSLRSSDIGAPHRRERVFIIANSIVGREYETDKDNQFVQLVGSEDSTSTDSHKELLYRILERGKRGGFESSDSTSTDASGSGTRRDTGAVSIKEESGWIEQNGINPSESYTSAATYATSERSQRSESEGGCELLTGRANAHTNSRRQQSIRESNSEWENECWNNPDGLAGEEQDWGKYEGGIRRWESIFEPAPKPLTEAGRLSPNFVEWMMGYPQDWTDGVSRSQRLKMLGNSVQVQCAYEVATIVKSLAEF